MSHVLNGTIRPDLSQVEADATQVAADPRFALFHAARRPFFGEGSDQFDVGNTLVYTRRIVQPDAAFKLTGRLGRANILLLSALDAVPAGRVRSRDACQQRRLSRNVSSETHRVHCGGRSATKHAHTRQSDLWEQRVRPAAEWRLELFDTDFTIEDGVPARAAAFCARDRAVRSDAA